MEKEEKKRLLKKQIADLRSGNRGVILEALKEVRQESDLSVLQELFMLLLEREEEDIRKEIASILNDLKNKEAAGVLADALGKEEYRPIAGILVASCWQNGLDYGKYADTFVTLALEADFEVALEAVTVLEEAFHELEDEEKRVFVSKLKTGILNADPLNQALIHNLIKSIS